MQSWIWLATIALVFFGITGVTQKLSTNNISFELSLLWFCAAFVVIAGVIAATMQLDWHVSPSMVAFAALGGLLNGLGALTSCRKPHRSRARLGRTLPLPPLMGVA